MPGLIALAVAALTGATIGFAAGRTTAIRGGVEPRHAASKAFVCDGCGKQYATETEAVQHAIVSHGAPDHENAEYIIREVAV